MAGYVRGALLFVVVAIVWLAGVAAEDATQRRTRIDRLHLAVRVTPRVLFGGRDARIECRTPRIPTHRDVEWGLDCPNFRRASRETAGRVLYESFVHVPARTCGTCYAFCDVRQFDRMPTLSAVPMSLLVIGVGCPDDPPPAF